MGSGIIKYGHHYIWIFLFEFPPGGKITHQDTKIKFILIILCLLAVVVTCSITCAEYLHQNPPFFL